MRLAEFYLTTYKHRECDPARCPWSVVRQLVRAGGLRPSEATRVAARLASWHGEWDAWDSQDEVVSLALDGLDGPFAYRPPLIEGVTWTFPDPRQLSMW